MIAAVSSESSAPPQRLVTATYVVPLRRDRVGTLADLPAYLGWLRREVQVIVVDGSGAEVFQHHAEQLPEGILHVPVDPDLETPMGKVGGVLTGLRLANSERVVIADDDVRYEVAPLRRVIAWLDGYDVVRPQNYFKRTPWHALWDISRSLLNRALGGGDWPGTLGVRRHAVLDAGGYRGDVMFENLELVRTVRAAGGRELVARDLFVGRCPSTVRVFLGQRVRQAYDELARPLRMAFFLAMVPAIGVATAIAGWWVAALVCLAAIGVAEAGRRRADGARFFPWTASLFAPAWLLERGVTSWLAVGCRLFLGGIPYRGRRLRDAATPIARLNEPGAIEPRVAV
ncbi:MAG: hypothetical protein QOK05_785 [Chloroflexota bacterium]|jgi:cellulose synthase/poly-beta-1,6-N-acetylglucosamine synthase-like glycosyltransferase|nr:hypothetical protein [Chloroflexota bacterium]